MVKTWWSFWLYPSAEREKWQVWPINSFVLPDFPSCFHTFPISVVFQLSAPLSFTVPHVQTSMHFGYWTKLLCLFLCRAGICSRGSCVTCQVKAVNGDESSGFAGASKYTSSRHVSPEVKPFYLLISYSIRDSENMTVYLLKLSFCTKVPHVFHALGKHSDPVKFILVLFTLGSCFQLAHTQSLHKWLHTCMVFCSSWINSNIHWPPHLLY